MKSPKYKFQRLKSRLMVASGSREEGLGVTADREGVSLPTPPHWEQGRGEWPFP